MTKYEKWYNSIIETRKATPYDGEYSETHHIIPKCLGGTDDKDNLVVLSAREHFMCHLLLSKIYDDYRIKFAVVMMTKVNPHQQREIKINSQIYEYLKRQHSIACTIRNRNREYQRGYVTAIEIATGKIKKFPSVKDIPDGWVRGSGSTGKSVNKGKVYWHKDGKVIALDSGVEPPEGYVRGNINNVLTGKRFSGKKYYHNPETGEEARLDECPNGWLEGRLYVWITDGIANKQHNRYAALPDGYRFGRTNKQKRSQTE